MAPTRKGPVDQLVERLRESRKYGDLCGETLTRAAAWGLERHASARAAEKAAKRKLHQVSGAYTGAGPKRVAELVSAWSGDEERTFCRKVMALHASTAERLGILDEVYDRLLEARPKRVVDLACGLNPFSLPWMAANTDSRMDYAGLECDGQLADAANGYLDRSGRAGEVVCGDILTDGMVPDGDVVLLMKTLPCLEQQAPGSAFALLKRLAGRKVIASYPTRSLGGRPKGMPEHYANELGDHIASLPFSVQSQRFASETFYVLDPVA